MAKMEWGGIRQPLLPFFRTTWLPLCRTCANPRRSRARIASSPETCPSLGVP
jgi:hypothetical protein